MSELFDLSRWIDLTFQIVPILFGGGLVFLTNWAFERRAHRRDEGDRRRKEQSILTGIFSIRNLLAIEMEIPDGEPFNRDRLPVLNAARKNLHQLLEKSEPSSQGFMMAIFDIALRLDVLISIIEYSDDALDQHNPTFVDAFGMLMGAMEVFDITTHSALDFISNEELSKFTQEELLEERDLDTLPS